MIDLDEIESAARKPWYCRSKLEDNLLSPEVLVELITRLRQAEKDAARYRWLRDLPDGSAHEEIGNYPGDMWDESIDEAMQCK
jgi:hypothetical protein